MKNTSFILYKATSPSGKFYIGITSRTLSTRINEHFYSMKRVHTKFSTALKKYTNKMIWEILCKNLTKQQAIEAEIQYIQTLQPQYNIAPGGEGTSGVLPSIKTRKRMSIAHTKRWAKLPKWKRVEAMQSMIDLTKRKVIDNRTGIIYESGADASRKLGLDCARIHKICKGLPSMKWNLSYYEGAV